MNFENFQHKIDDFLRKDCAPQLTLHLFYKVGRAAGCVHQLNDHKLDRDIFCECLGQILVAVALIANSRGLSISASRIPQETKHIEPFSLTISLHRTVLDIAQELEVDTSLDILEHRLVEIVQFCLELAAVVGLSVKKIEEQGLSYAKDLEKI